MSWDAFQRRALQAMGLSLHVLQGQAADRNEGCVTSVTPAGEADAFLHALLRAAGVRDAGGLPQIADRHALRVQHDIDAMPAQEIRWSDTGELQELR